MMNWNDCIHNNKVRTITPDLERAKALQKTAKARITNAKSMNKNFIFEDYYSSIQELIHAHAFRNGFNILNHLCLGFYLRDFIQKESFYKIFDDLRYKRNSLTYYGIMMDDRVLKKTLEDCKRLFDELTIL